MAAPLSHRRPADFDRFWFGAPYYPEHWDQATMETDAERMKAAGFNIVRLAEFAWNVIEAKEGVIDFSLFDEAIEKLGKEGIMTMMCTPTATPPRWLTVKHPDMYRVDDKGVAMTHGSRQHCCHTNATFREESRRITKIMAEHYADNPYVVSWQTDNEINCHFSECHCDSCQVNFRLFLKNRYGTIEELNDRWGTAFWALTYDSFDDIETPREGRPTYVNPSAFVDYRRFLDHSVTVFQAEQIDILREANPNWFIIHNGIMSNIDYRGKFTEDLDVLGYDIYPMFDVDPVSRDYSHAFNLDRTRSYSGNFIVPEHQSGPGGQANYFHNNPEPGELTKMSYRSIARGADSLMYFRWRTCRFGAEEYWCGILDHDNVPRRRYDEVVAVGDDLKQLGPAILGSSVYLDTAIAYGDYDVARSHQSYPLGLPSEGNIAEECHRVLLQDGLAAGCVHPEDDLTGIKLYIIPHWALFKPEWIPALTKFVEDGGTLVIGARTASKTPDNHISPETHPGCLRNLVGATVEEYGRQNLPHTRPMNLTIDGNSVQSKDWYEVIATDEAEVLATWTGRHLDGETAASVNRIGKGSVVYVGTYLRDSILKALLPKLRELSGVTPIHPQAGPKLEVVIREKEGGNVWFFINNSDDELAVDSLPEGTNLRTLQPAPASATLPRHGVLIIQTDE